MRWRKVIPLLLVLQSMLLPEHVAKAQQLIFETLRSEDGLSNSTVFDIVQDSKGFLWIATPDGLNRYDGKNFEVFRRVGEAPISDNEVHFLLIDDFERLWIGTRSGISCLDLKTYQMSSYWQDPAQTLKGSDYIHCMALDQRGDLWFGVYGGLYRMNTESGEAVPMLLDDIEGGKSATTWSLHLDPDGRIWAGTINGLYIFEADDDEWPDPIHYVHDPSDPDGIPSERIWEFAVDVDGNLWGGSYEGIYKVEGDDVRNLTFLKINSTSEITNNLSYSYVENIHIDEDNVMRIGTYSGGINITDLDDFDGTHMEFEVVRSRPEDPQSLPSDEVNCVYRDASGITWFGTAAGLCKVDPLANRFATVRKIPNESASLSSNVITHVLMDSRDRLWVGTRGGGVNLARSYPSLDFDHFLADGEKGSIAHNDVYDIYEDQLGYIWILSYRGLDYCHVDEVSSGTWKHLNHKDGLAHNYCLEIREEEPGDYWVATYGGLNRMKFDPRTAELGDVRTYTSDPRDPRRYVNSCTFSTSLDSSGRSWFGTFSGLSCFVPPTDSDTEWFRNYLNDKANPNSLSNNRIHKLFLDGKSRLWVGTNDGLNLVTFVGPEMEPAFKSFGLETGFPSSLIHEIQEDESGLLWVSTNGGIVLFDPDKALLGLDPLVRVFNFGDGLQGNEFMPRSSCRSDDGTLFFGGINGLNIISPENFSLNQTSPKVAINQIQVMGRELQSGTEYNGRVLIEEHVSQIQELALEWDERSFNIRLSCLNFSFPEKNKLAWRLIGLSNEWTTMSDGAASFTNIDPGSYTFEYKAANNDGVWSPVYSLGISISNPPWSSWWAYIIYVVLLVSIILIFVRARIKRQTSVLTQALEVQRAREEERNLLRRKTAADFHDELGHRLTKISLYSELLKRQVPNDEKLSEFSSRIEDNTKGLAEGVRDLIWAFDPERDTLLEMLLRLQDFGEKLFEHMNIAFRLRGMDEAFDSLAIDAESRRQILLIFKEVLNNAAKYSQCTSVEVDAFLNGNELQIHAKDNGVGFDAEDAKSGNGLKNMRDRAAKIDAEFDLSSVVGEGTVAKLTWTVQN